ncbi:hypothetical protein HID58_029028 [Brassica napus]|uniref:Uncharacterized protein n=1 Tax=Brassica napus TaxID=3708 RepID=A0ABQ8CBX5_BRANA|nr:hypothetical protein HID58_029028 [Brassica napus]
MVIASRSGWSCSRGATMTFTWWRLAKNIMTSRKKRAAKEKAKEAAKPEEETVNERNEYFVLLVDVLDAEHDPQMTVLPMMEYREEKEEGWRVWDSEIFFCKWPTWVLFW